MPSEAASALASGQHLARLACMISSSALCTALCAFACLLAVVACDKLAIVKMYVSSAMVQGSCARDLQCSMVLTQHQRPRTSLA